MSLKIQAQALEHLLAVLNDQEYIVVGPTVTNNTISLEPISHASDLPAGYTDQQAPGEYQLQKTNAKTYFGFQLGAQHWRRFLQPDEEILWRASRTPQSISFIASDRSQEKPYAFIGARSCDLHAIAELDKTFLNGTYQDRNYAERRASSLIIAVNCSEAGNTCFCHATQTGPHTEGGYDILLDELHSPSQHSFLISTGSDIGSKIVSELKKRCGTEAVEPNDIDLVDAGKQRAIEKMSSSPRQLFKHAGGVEELKEGLYRKLEHPYWETVAESCLSCSNCTLVCPTCFCNDVKEETDLANQETAHVRHWDSCFTMEHSHLPEGSVRQSTKARYRQWLVHKFASWQDQFDSLGCVGCGRCITWCPVGIDVVESVNQVMQPSTTRSVMNENIESE